MPPPIAPSVPSRGSGPPPPPVGEVATDDDSLLCSDSQPPNAALGLQHLGQVHARQALLLAGSFERDPVLFGLGLDAEFVAAESDAGGDGSVQLLLVIWII